MSRMNIVCVVVALALALGPLSAWLAPEAAAQSLGTLTGEVRDLEGKPFADVTLIIKNSEMGQTFETKTDKSGKYFQSGLRGGIYIVTVKVKDQVVYETNTRVSSGEEAKLNFNFKELSQKQGAAAIEAQKKQEEEKKKFENLKGHFDSGVAALEQAKTLRAEAQRTPAGQRGPLQQKLNDLYGTAINELQSAEKAAGEKDPNRHIVLAKLGESYEMSGRFEEAAAAYQKAIELKPDQAGYYNNLGNALAKLGKIDEAQAAYQKSVSLDPANAASAWRNLGIVLYNAGKSKEAVEPLRKATELDPKNAQGWYLLGAALVGAMGSKQEGDRVIPVLQPGTIEAYQKCIEVDPNGAYGAQCKQGLEQLEAMGVGIPTKLKTRPKK
ncbi:MAG TPA: tetratricopeptide repeat protein [Candidatus Acidoferrales bacterium]|nr:tetratricopeptide repeat protein [Candidatus Acidoferrales bacterium]